MLDKVFIGQAIYSMALNNRRKEIIFGVNNGLQFHQLFETKEGFSHYIDSKPHSILREHTDIVRCIVVVDSRIYSTGYDGAMVIYDCQFAGKESANKYFKNSRAHEAGISCLNVEKDNHENTVWVFTGSFDKTCKVWTGDGKLIHKFDGFNNGVTGLCYSPKNRTICCAAGSNTATIYDPKSGENVTEFIDTFANEAHGNHGLHLLKYLNEFNMMLATTNRKQLIVYKYNPNGCLTSLKYKKTLDSLCYTSKIPILIFSGDSNGEMFKWEQRHTSQIIYGNEHMIKSELVMRETSRIQGASFSKTKGLRGSRFVKQTAQSDEFLKSDINQIKKSNVILKMIYVESLDLVVAACEDANIYVWGFDQEAVKILKNMKYDENEKKKDNKHQFNCFEKINYKDYLKSLTATYNIENVSNVEPIEVKDDGESVTNRVAGFILKKILSEHTSCVTSLVVVERPDLYPSTFLLSAGWDRRVFIKF